MRSLQTPGTGSPTGRPSGFTLLWLAALLMPAVTFALVALETTRATNAEARARILRVADMLHEQALTAFEISEGLLDASIRRVQGMAWRDVAASVEVHQFLREVEQRVPSVVTLGLVAPDGLIAASSRNPPPLGVTSLAARDYVLAHTTGDRTLLSDGGTFVTGIFETTPSHLTV